MQCLINKGFCLHLLINFLSHLRHFTLLVVLLLKERYVDIIESIF